MKTFTLTRKNTPAIFHSFYRRRVLKFQVTITEELRFKRQEIGYGEPAYGEQDRHYLVDLASGTKQPLSWQFGSSDEEAVVPLPIGTAVAHFRSAYPADWEFFMTPSDAKDLRPVVVKESSHNTLFLKGAAAA